jgi:hypothetical protein
MGRIQARRSWHGVHRSRCRAVQFVEVQLAIGGGKTLQVESHVHSVLAYAHQFRSQVPDISMIIRNIDMTPLSEARMSMQDDYKRHIDNVQSCCLIASI